jgi:hypothetical protein
MSGNSATVPVLREEVAGRVNLDFTTGSKGFSWLAKQSNAEPQRIFSSGLALAI